MTGSCPERSGQHGVHLHDVRMLRANLPSPCFIDRAITAASPLLTGINWVDRQEVSVGSRPCTTNGLPLVGATRSKRVHVAGVHGMRGVARGPLTGKMLAASITGDSTPAVMRHFNPLR